MLAFGNAFLTNYSLSYAIGGMPLVSTSYICSTMKFEQATGNSMEAVPVNSKIRGRFVLSEVNYKKNGRWLTKTTCTIEIEGKEKPAAIVEALTLYVVSE